MFIVASSPTSDKSDSFFPNETEEVLIIGSFAIVMPLEKEVKFDVIEKSDIMRSLGYDNSVLLQHTNINHLVDELLHGIKGKKL